MRTDKAHWPRGLLWHGWLPMLSGVNGPSPWAVDASESAAYLVEVALGRYSSGLIADWVLSDEFDHDSAASSLPDHPGQMAVWFLIISLVSLLLELVSLLISLSIFGMIVGEIMLMVFVQMMMFRHVVVSAPFLGLCSLFRELKCGVSV